jgi:hypothetical protein
VSRDPTRYVRFAVIDALKSLAIEGMDDRWYPQQIPPNQPFPYGFVGVPIMTLEQIQCMNASTIRFAIHAYTVEETPANKISERLVELDGACLDLETVGCPYPATLDLTFVNSTPVRDNSENTIFHLIVNMLAEVTA